MCMYVYMHIYLIYDICKIHKYIKYIKTQIYIHIYNEVGQLFSVYNIVVFIFLKEIQGKYVNFGISCL